METKNRQIRNGVLLYIDKASVADTGVYICKYGQNQNTFKVQVLGRQTWVNLNCLTKEKYLKNIHVVRPPTLSIIK